MQPLAQLECNRGFVPKHPARQLLEGWICGQLEPNRQDVQNHHEDKQASTPIFDDFHF